jgi:hypothetical protein
MVIGVKTSATNGTKSKDMWDERKDEWDELVLKGP